MYLATAKLDRKKPPQPIVGLLEVQPRPNGKVGGRNSKGNWVEAPECYAETSPEAALEQLSGRLWVVATLSSALGDVDRAKRAVALRVAVEGARG